METAPQRGEDPFSSGSHTQGILLTSPRSITRRGDEKNPGTGNQGYTVILGALKRNNKWTTDKIPAMSGAQKENATAPDASAQ